MSENKLERKLFIKNYDRMVKDLIQETKEGHIILNPDYQRKYIWDNKKASRLVESILLNIPIPVIYASEQEDSSWNIVDGVQRLKSLERFVNNDFKLNGLEVLYELNGKKFIELDEKIQQKLLRGELRVILLLNESDNNIQFDIFMRLNSGAVKLTEQELRNCLYRGPLNTMIKDIAEGSEVLKIIFPVRKIDRLQNHELVLRFLAIKDNFDYTKLCMSNYDGRLKNLLNNFMKKYQDADVIKLNEFKNSFIDTIDKVYEVYGKDAFRQLGSGKINTPMYDCVMLAFEKYDLQTLITNKNNILDMTQKIYNDEKFTQYITKSTNNSGQMNGRIKYFIDKMEEVVVDASDK